MPYPSPNIDATPGAGDTFQAAHQKVNDHMNDAGQHSGGTALGKLQGLVLALQGLKDANRAGLAAGDVVFVDGYHASGDKAGIRPYRLAKNSSAAGNDGTVVVPTGAGTPGDRWLLDWTTDLNVCWFGARADYASTTGTGTDNAPIFAAAKAALDATRGGDLVVPVGSYAFATTWNIGAAVRLSVRGVGSMVSTEGKDQLRGSSLVWIGAAGGDMIQVNPAAAASGDVRHSGPRWERLNLVSHTARAGRAMYVRATTGSRYRDCVVRDFATGLEFDSQEGTHGGVIPGGDAAWTVVDGLHEYDCDKGIYVPYSAGLRVINGKFMHRLTASQTAIHIKGGPQMVVAHNKFDSVNNVAAVGILAEGQFSHLAFNNFEDMGVGIRVGAGTTHADDGYGNDLSHNRFHTIAGQTSIDVTGVLDANSQKRVRYTNLIGNQYKGGGTYVVDNGSLTYRRDALAPNG